MIAPMQNTRSDIFFLWGIYDYCNFLFAFIEAFEHNLSQKLTSKLFITVSKLLERYFHYNINKINKV